LKKALWAMFATGCPSMLGTWWGLFVEAPEPIDQEATVAANGNATWILSDITVIKRRARSPWVIQLACSFE
jgi:hypothetical protein